MSRIRIKVCGNRDPASSLAVASLGPDIMGWIFAAESPRCISIADAQKQIQAIASSYPEIAHWAVITTESVGLIPQIMSFIPQIQHIQLVADIQTYNKVGQGLAAGIQLVPALRVKSPVRDAYLAAYQDAPFFVMDAFVAGKAGGTGKRLNSLHLAQVQRPFFLAGGLTPDNVLQALQEMPGSVIGVDSSSGLEGAVPGEKDPLKVKQFIEQARSFNR